MERYVRNHSSISHKEQLQINNLNVAIIGLGGLGGYVLENLLRIGVKKFILIDKGKFEESNLNRQLLSTEENIGEYKTLVAEKRAISIEKDVILKTYSTKLYKKSINLIKGVDIVFDCLDSIESRFDLEYICEKLELPLVHGAIRGYYGQVALSREGNRIFKKIYKDNTKENESLGNLPMTCMITASIQINLSLKYLFENYREKELILIDSNEIDIEKIKIL